MPRVDTYPYPGVPRGNGGRASGPAQADDAVARARAGDMQAWGRLYQDYFARIYRHVRFLAGSEPATEDLVQEAFARALVALPDFDFRSSFSTWLHGIALNVVRNHWRSQRSTATAHQRLEQMRAITDEPRNEVDQTHLCRRKAEAVYAVLEGLPEHLREAFVLRDLEGFSPTDAAEQLGITPGNLSVRASRARERIRRELERLGWVSPRDEGGSE